MLKAEQIERSNDQPAELRSDVLPQDKSTVAHKASELRAEPRVEIEQVVFAGALVTADIEVQQSAVFELSQQCRDLVAENWVRHRVT